MKTALYTYKTGECGDGCCSWNESTVQFFDHDGKELYGMEREGSFTFYEEADFQEWLDDFNKYDDEPFHPHPETSYY